MNTTYLEVLEKVNGPKQCFLDIQRYNLMKDRFITCGTGKTLRGKEKKS